MQPTTAQLDDMVLRIVEAVHPVRIILFGSAARGEMRQSSDLDVAVIVPEGVDPHTVSELIYPRLVGLGIAVDIFVATSEQLDRYRTAVGMIYREILRDGQELYAA